MVVEFMGCLGEVWGCDDGLAVVAKKDSSFEVVTEFVVMFRTISESGSSLVERYTNQSWRYAKKLVLWEPF